MGTVQLAFGYWLAMRFELGTPDLNDQVDSYENTGGSCDMPSSFCLQAIDDALPLFLECIIYVNLRLIKCEFTVWLYFCNLSIKYNEEKTCYLNYCIIVLSKRKKTTIVRTWNTSQKPFFEFSSYVLRLIAGKREGDKNNISLKQKWFTSNCTSNFFTLNQSCHLAF